MRKQLLAFVLIILYGILRNVRLLFFCRKARVALCTLVFSG